MVICCVPNCGADSWKCDGSVTFYDFPSNPDLAAKWIKQINTAVKARPMWFPRGRPVICSKHFLHTDFKGDTDSLKPRCIPTVFGHKYIGQNPESNLTNKLDKSKTTPLIVKVIIPKKNAIKENSQEISDSRSVINANGSSVSSEHSPEIQILNDNSQVSTHNNEVYLQVSSQNRNSRNNLYISSNGASSSGATNEKQTKSPTNSQQNKSNTSFIKWDRGPKGNTTKPNPLSKTPLKKKEKINSDLIEIGPNTFLKINPDIIKVNKKLTPSGNTVLQFLMDQKHAKNYSSDILPKLIQGVPPSAQEDSSSQATTAVQSNESVTNSNKEAISNPPKNDSVQHVLGHVVDTNAYKETCADMPLNNDKDDDDCAIMEDISQDENNASNVEKNNNSDKADTSFIEKAPVLLTTTMPLNQCLLDKPKYLLQMKQKNRQISSLKVKISTLTKKIEELEDRCIVQERQLSYSFIKRLKSIRKNAAKGDPRATYILEQIRGYSNNSKMRWSDSTLTQCAIWCRKAPYAYEYFKKADFFKLPCLGSVKRFMKKHPEIKFMKKITTSDSQNKNGAGGNEDNNDDDSSDFDFDMDDDDGQDDNNEASGNEANKPVECETILSVPSENENQTAVQGSSTENNANTAIERNEITRATEIIANHSEKEHTNVQNNSSENSNAEKASNSPKHTESSGIPITVDSTNLELQEIILPSGEVVQCYSSTIGNGADIGGGQYYIIPNVEQNSSGDHEYSVIQADSLPVVLQNLETSQLHLQQDQLIFIANNSSDQVECNETEVATA